MTRALLVVLASLALTSCWIGRSLYSPADARPAIPPGVNRTIAPDEPKRAYRVTILPNGAHAVRHRRKAGGLRLRSARSGQLQRLGRG